MAMRQKLSATVRRGFVWLRNRVGLGGAATFILAILQLIVIGYQADIANRQFKLAKQQLDLQKSSSDSSDKTATNQLKLLEKQTQILSDQAQSLKITSEASKNTINNNRANLWVGNDGPVLSAVFKGDQRRYALMKLTLVNYGMSTAKLSGFKTEVYRGENALPGESDVRLFSVDPGDYGDVSDEGIATVTSDPNAQSTSLSPYPSVKEVPGLSSVNIYKRFEFVGSSTDHMFLPPSHSYLWVFVSYKDIFGASHETSIFVYPSSNEIPTGYQALNCFDDKCPSGLFPTSGPSLPR